MNIMITVEELKKKLSHKHLVVDTNLLLEAEKSPEYFSELFSFILEAQCIPILTRFTEFEFMRNSFQKEVQQKQRAFLDAFGFMLYPLAIQPDALFEEAVKIANHYQARKFKDTSLVDCCLGALLRLKRSDLLLITRNHKDFPETLFERHFVWNVGFERDVLAFGIYQARDIQL